MKAAALALLSTTGIACAAIGTVRTADRRFDGAVSIRSDGWRVGDRKVPAAAVVYAVPDRDRPVAPRRTAMRTVDGEIWQAELLALENGRLRIRSPVAGLLDFPLDSVERLFFDASAPAPPPDAPGPAMYLRAGEPIPGELTGLDREHVLMDSPLGSLRLARGRLTAYVLSSPPAHTPDAASELALADGSVLRGAIELTDGGVILKHPSAGAIAAPAHAIYAIINRAPGITLLGDIEPALLVQRPLVAGRNELVLVASTGAGGGARALRGLHMQPFSEAVFTAPAAVRGATPRFNARIEPPPDARGDAVFSISAGEGAIFEVIVKPGEPAREISVPLPPSAQFRLRTDFGRRLLFPCGVFLNDVMLVGGTTAAR